MGVAVLATLVSSVGDEAEYDLVADLTDTPVRVRFRWDGENIHTDVDEDRMPVYVRAGIRAVAVARTESGQWPPRAVRQS